MQGGSNRGLNLISRIVLSFFASGLGPFPAFEGAGGEFQRGQELPPSQGREFSSVEHLVNWNFILWMPEHERGGLCEHPKEREVTVGEKAPGTS